MGLGWCVATYRLTGPGGTSWFDFPGRTLGLSSAVSSVFERGSYPPLAVVCGERAMLPSTLSKAARSLVCEFAPLDSYVDPAVIHSREHDR